jgi:hypothetical protein
MRGIRQPAGCGHALNHYGRYFFHFTTSETWSINQNPTPLTTILPHIDALVHTGDPACSKAYWRLRSCSAWPAR